jgi:hypothetical protein
VKFSELLTLTGTEGGEKKDKIINIINFLGYNNVKL